MTEVRSVAYPLQFMIQTSSAVSDRDVPCEQGAYHKSPLYRRGKGDWGGRGGGWLYTGQGAPIGTEEDAVISL